MHCFFVPNLSHLDQSYVLHVRSFVSILDRQLLVVVFSTWVTDIQGGLFLLLFSMFRLPRVA